MILRRPKVSVVLPIYNEEASLSAAVASVLDQSYDNIELLIVDDGSDRDLSPVLGSVLHDSRLEIFRHEQNRGAAAARNTGIRQARGDYIAFLDSDDVWHHEKLNRQLAYMAKNRDVPPVSCTAFRIITPFRREGELRRPRSEIRFYDLLWGCSISPGSTMLAKKALFDRIGPFDESLRRLEDWDWLLRCAQVTPIAVVPEVLAVVRTGLRERYPLSTLLDAAKILKDYALSGRYSLEERQEYIFFSTLHTELAAAAFLRRHYGAAIGSFLTAFYYHPIKRREYYRRILRAIMIDLTQGR